MASYEMLNDILKKEDTQKNIAQKYHYTEGYVSQIATKFKQLRYPPKIDGEGNLICYKCEKKKGKMVFHHSNETGGLLALICHSCNIKIGKNELEYGNGRGGGTKYAVLQIRMDEDLYNAFQELANEFADGNTSKYGRKLIKRVVRFNHDRSNR